MDDNPETRSPVEGLSLDRFQGRTMNREYLITVGTVLVTVLQNNPNRTHWIVINEGANDVRLSIDPTISASSGWLLAAANGVLSMDYAEDGEGVTYQVFGISGVAGNVVRIREVVRS